MTEPNEANETEKPNSPSSFEQAAHAFVQEHTPSPRVQKLLRCQEATRQKISEWASSGLALDQARAVIDGPAESVYRAAQAYRGAEAELQRAIAAEGQAVREMIEAGEELG